MLETMVQQKKDDFQIIQNDRKNNELIRTKTRTAMAARRGGWSTRLLLQ